MPLLAMTGSRVGAMITVRNISQRAAILAMRRVSMAEAKPIVVKFGITRKPTVFTAGKLIGDAVTGVAILTLLFMIRDASGVRVHAGFRIARTKLAMQGSVL